GFPCTASHCLLTSSPDSAHVPLFRSPHTAGGFHFVIRVLYGLSIAAASTATTVAPHSGFGPRRLPK
ncbi:unnamed protein product, partial [Staurois parvus]